ncbi:MAG: hypothetical protein J3R72DRAFT_518497 [Linnemannia gamsii]|nr:MAG: hypothetical protein J3R72DRAFT_518497 [Linnemannia gamsii]
MAVSPITGMRIWVAFLTFINLSVTISFFSYYAALTDLSRMRDTQDESFLTGLEWGDICSILTAVILFGIYAYSVWARNKVTSLIQNRFLRAILILIPAVLLLYIECRCINALRIMQNRINESRRNRYPEFYDEVKVNNFVCDKENNLCFLMLSQLFLAVITGLFVVVEVAMSFFTSPHPSNIPQPVTKWNLPKLKSLELLEAPTLQSNYDSLETMRCQEELTLVIRRRTDLEDQLQGIPRLSTYTNPNFAHLARRQSVVVDTDVSINDTFTKFQISQSRITEHELAASMTHQRLPLVAFTPATPNIPLSAVEESLTTGGPTLDVSNRIGDNVVWGISMNPESFMESKLERLTLSGPCVIAAPDLVVLYRNRDHFEGNKVLLGGSAAEIENEVSYITEPVTNNTTTTTAAKDKQVIGAPYLKAPFLPVFFLLFLCPIFNDHYPTGL